MRLIFHGLLQKLFGDEVVMHVESVAEAIEGFSRQQPAWPRDMRIAIAGFESADQLTHFAEEVHVLPALWGGGGKFGTIILGAALVGLAFATGGASLAASGGLVTTALGGTLLVTGGLMVLQGVMGLFMKSPKADKSSDPDASKYLGVNKNTTDSGTPITMAWGRIDLQPHYLSIQSDSTNLSYGIFPANP